MHDIRHSILMITAVNDADDKEGWHHIKPTAILCRQSSFELAEPTFAAAVPCDLSQGIGS